MSAHDPRNPKQETGPQKGQIIAINPSSALAASPGASGIHSEMDAFLIASAQIEAVLSQSRANCQRLKHEISSLQARHDEALRAMGSRLRESEAREAAGREAIAGLQGSERRLSAQIQSLQERLAALKGELERAQSHSTELRAAAQARLDAFSKREERFKSMILAHRSREADLGARVASLKEALERSQNEITLYKNSWTQVLQNEREAQDFLRQRDEATKQKEALEARLRALEERNLAVIAEARDRIQSLEATARELKEQVAASQPAVDAAREAAEKFRAEAEALRAQAEADATALRADAEEREAAIRAEADARAAALAGELEAARAATERMRADTEDLIRRLNAESDAQAERAFARARGEADRDLAQAQARVTDLEAALAAERAAASATGQAFESRLRGMEAELQAIRAEAARPPAPPTADFERALAERQALQEERNALRAQLERAIADMTLAREEALTQQDKANRLKRTYPLRDLLTQKEAEIGRASRDLKSIGKTAPAETMKQAESALAALVEQRDELRKILRETDRG